MNFVWGYILISITLLTIIFVRDKNSLKELIQIFDLSEVKKTTKPIVFYPFLLLVGLIMILLMALLICTSPYIFYNHLRKFKTNDFISGDFPDKDYSSIVPRPYTPYYDILFFSLIGKLKMDLPIVQKLINNFDRYDQLAFPILFDHIEAEQYLFKESFRQSMEDLSIALFIFDIREYKDKPFEENDPVSYLNSNTNFSWPSRYLDASASTLSYLLGIPIDGENKLVLIDKSDVNRLKIIPFDKNMEDIDFSDLKVVSYSEIILDQPYYNYIAQFLSLRWTNSKMNKNKPIKQCAKKIRSQLYERYRIDDPAILNVFKLTEKGPKPWNVFYRLREPTKEEKEISRVIFNKSYDEILSLYPDFNESNLDYIKSKALESKLEELVLLEGLEYESKIFLKSANTVYSMFVQEEDVEQMDYSPVAIGYTKFFEKEVNVSVVQSIRKELGIRMPTYFNKYCPVQGAYEIKINDKFKVDYNMKNQKTGGYLAPGLGQTFNALEIEIDKIDGDKNKLNELLVKGRKLNNIRNRAAHPELIGREDVDQIRDLILRLYLHKVLDDLITTKKRLSN